MSAQGFPDTDLRFTALQQWFASQAVAVAKTLGIAALEQGSYEAVGSDASFRRYFRWQDGQHELVLMDAPPPQEDCRPFVRMAGVLAGAGLRVPEILAADLEQGFLVLTDLGRQTWLQVLDDENADSLFASAIDVLVRLQQIAVAPLALPSYDEALLRRELQLFPEWYLSHERGVQLDERQQAWWQQTCDLLVAAALSQKQVLVHRDFMPRNLMLGTTEPGVLDFQDAVAGPASYDAISLFKDAFLSWPQARVDGWLQQYWQQARQAGIPVAGDWTAFQRDCDWMGLQRHLKVIGIFARICHRDGKPRYLADVPRFFAYIQPVVARYPELAPLRQLLASLGLEARL